MRKPWTIAAVSLLLAGVIAAPARAIVVGDAQCDSLCRSLGGSSPYESVGRFNGTTATTAFLASGTLVASDWVLTAAHVVDDAKTLNFSIGGQIYQVDRKIAYPGWNGDLWSGCDIGLVHLTVAVANITPAQLYTGTAELNHTDTVVGYGKTGTGATGDTKCDGVKRGAQNVISQIENHRLLVADFENRLSAGLLSFSSETAQPLEGLIAPGDSGGGLFITTPTGTYLAGVNSFVGSDYGAPRSVYGNFSGHTRVSAYCEWIEANIHGETLVNGPLVNGSLVNGSGADEAKSPIFAAPEPGSLVLLLAAGAMLWASRRLLRRA